MTDLARLPVQYPEGEAALILSDDGTIRVEPGEALRDALAGREEQALALTQTVTRVGLVLMGLGLAAVAGGWYAGRLFGKLAFRLMEPRPVRDVTLSPDAHGHLRARLGKALWSIGGHSPQEAEEFLRVFDDLKG